MSAYWDWLLRRPIESQVDIQQGDPTGGRATRPPLNKFRSGQPLPSLLQQDYERAFGRSFSHVRVNADARANALAIRHGAQAIAVGSEVFFRSDQYIPGTLRTEVMLAHELAHVAQQDSFAATSSSTAEQELESDADRSAAAAVMTRRGLGAPGLAMPRERSALSLRRCDPKTRESALEGPIVCDPTPYSATATPAALTQKQFLEATTGAAVPLAALQLDPDVAGAGLESADVNRDGSISGPGEWRILFRLLSSNQERLELTKGGQATSAAVILAGLARAAQSASLARAVGAVSLAGAVTLVGLTAGSVSEAQSLRRQAPVQLIAPASGVDRGVVLGGKGQTLDLGKDEDLDSFVRSLPIPLDVRQSVRTALGNADVHSRRELAELARVWSGAYCGRDIPRRLILSGHGDGVWISGGPDDFIRREWILGLGRAMPVAAQLIYSIHLGTCQHGWEPRFNAWREVFPNVQVLWGYAGHGLDPGAWLHWPTCQTST
jgi:hypothetical protein